MAFGQTRDEKVRNLQKLPEQKTAEKPVAIPVGNIGIVNLEQEKKPHNITIKNYNQNEPKRTPNMKYSDKQRYRRYKTKTEPNLLSKIQVNEEDDIINKIKEAFGIQPDSQNSNYSKAETAPVPFYKGVDDLPVENIEDRRERIPERQEEITDISMEEAEELTFQKDPEYNFNTEFTPERMSRREKELYESFPEENPLSMALSTPTEKALLNRMSEQLTPPSRMMRTPEERKKAQDEADKIFVDAELTFERLAEISKEYVTKRKVGRPAGPYGPYKKRNDETDF